MLLAEYCQVALYAESLKPCRSTTHRSTLFSAGIGALTSTSNWIPPAPVGSWNFQLDAALVTFVARIPSYCQYGWLGAVNVAVPESLGIVTVPDPDVTVGPLMTKIRVPCAAAVVPLAVPSGWVIRFSIVTLNENCRV